MTGLFKWFLAALLVAAIATPACAEWHEAKSKHFTIYAEEDPAALREYAEKLERFDQAVRRVRGMGDPALTDSGRVTVFVLPSDASVARLARGSALGFYISEASGSVAFVPRNIGVGGQMRLRMEKIVEEDVVFFHEYAHHLQLQFASVALPIWIVEGFAEFFSTAEILQDGSVGIGLAPKHRAFGLMALRDLPLEEMVGELPKKMTGTQFEQIYGRGWLLMHYLSFEPTRHGQLTQYVDGIQQGKRPAEAAVAAFGDIKTLDRELGEYFRRKTLPYLVVPANELSVGPIAIRALRPGETALMQVHMRSLRGMQRRKAADAASDARRAAAHHPDDPFAQTVLARAEFDAGNYAAAEAAADRALSANPEYLRALIYKGRARMEIARADPAKADWKDVRSWFVRANQLDGENAEPLLLFYESYGYAGVEPTRNAVDGLMYGAALAPQDNRLRRMATIQLLRESRLQDAREMFAPMAFPPHAKEEWRETAPSIFEAIGAGDGRTALHLLEEAHAKIEAEARKR